MKEDTTRLRLLRLTLNADLLKGVGALVDIDFNYENLEFDLLVNNRTVLEYTIEIEKNNNLTFTYKNDEKEDGEDRNLIIENIEITDEKDTFHKITMKEIFESIGIDFGDRNENMSEVYSASINQFIFCSIIFDEKSKPRYRFDYPITIYNNQTWMLPIHFDK